jgi:hypothetical protein
MADNKEKMSREQRNTETFLAMLKRIVSWHYSEHLLQNYETEHGRNAVPPCPAERVSTFRQGIIQIECEFVFPEQVRFDI